MTRRQELLAAELHRYLTARFSDTPTVLALKGAGVQWRCIASRGDATCTIHCFILLEPEFSVDFDRNGQTMACGRFPPNAETVEAVADWRAGRSVAEMHARYPQVDRHKRVLQQVADEVCAAVPALQTFCELRGSRIGISDVRFAVGDRSCRISLWGTNALPDAEFAWDDCVLFRYRPDDHQLLAAVIERWVCDAAPPSQMRAEFPWLAIGELADYYEQGRGIEGEFLDSWNRIERFYGEELTGHGWDPLSQAALRLVREMRRAGYDRMLRAGQSVYLLGLSRSRRHGLRPDQPSLWFRVDPTGATMEVEADFLGDRLTASPVELTTEVRAMLDELAKVAVD